jgi:N,N'-diacetyllegionaminate synthase
MKIYKNTTYIIAEIGINHDGSLQKISKLIKLAKQAGADAVKFQLFEASTLANKANKKKYKLFKKYKKETLFQMWKRLSIKKNWLKKIETLCKILKIDLGFSVFDIKSLKMINGTKYQFLKIASGDLNDHFLIKKIIDKKKYNILSTGMANEKEIKKTCKLFNKKKLTLLHCVSLYPTSIKDINLRRMIKLKEYSESVGFSDHTIGIHASIKAITMGAKIIEKHFTYDNKADGPDHTSSANFQQLKLICQFTKSHQKMLGDGKVSPNKEETKMRIFARKSIFAKQNIKIGQNFTYKNIKCARPGTGIDASFFEKVIGKRSKSFFSKGDLIKLI